MTALTPKQRTAINATLALIHDAGHNATAISQQAKAAAAKGVPLKQAYDRAVEGFMAATPDMAGPISKVARLVMASDDATVAQYSRALDSYNATGDATALNALAPTIARDSIALAIKHGELTPGATGADALTAALGSEASPAMVDALNAPELAVSAPEAAPQAAPQTFQFKPGAAPANGAAGYGTGQGGGVVSAKAQARIPRDTPGGGAPQGWARGQGGGVVSPSAQARWARDFPGGIVPEGTRLAAHEQGFAG